MPAALTFNSGLLQAFHRYRGMAFPIGSILLLFVILVPLPTSLLDLLLVTNITLSAVVLITVMYIQRPLEFSVFPSLLLGLTLLRLVLNTATTRLILTNAQDGTAAGHVVEAFGTFVAGDSLVVGVIIFLIIFVIQFVVITKGATRIAEVAARFTLDGMPGKQMAIDADLNAGIIKEDEARRRREEVTREADFYGAMDGASKFVRGDAIAGIIITIVNILGGLYVGLVEQNMDLMQSLATFTKLTIGDGLVSQVPAFIISIGSAMLVTRNASKSNLGEEVLTQVTSQPIALFVAGGFLLILMVTPLRSFPLLLLAAGCTGLAYTLQRGRSRAARAQEVQARTAAATAKAPEKIESFLAVDPMSLEVGYGLVKLVDRKQGGDLLDRISSIRKQVAQDLGLLVPPIRIRDQLRLEPNQYTIKIKSIDAGRGEVLPGYHLAIDNGAAIGGLSGIETREPAFGLKAYWIAEEGKTAAEQRNYTVVPASSVLATHLTEIIKRNAASLLTRQETSRLIDTLKEHSAKLVEEVVPELLKLGDVQKVLQNLLREGVPIRDLETIVETLGDWATRTKDTEVLTEYVRNALARQICQQYLADDGRLYCVSLDPQMEDTISAQVERSDRGSFLNMPVPMQRRILDVLSREVDKAVTTGGGRTPVILCSPQIRAMVRRLVESAMSHIAVLGYNEVVSGIEVQSLGVAVLNHESANVPSTVHA